MKQKYHLAMDDAERRLLIGSLNDLRSRLFTEDRYTNAVDEVLLKIIGAKRKKFKSRCKLVFGDSDTGGT